MTDALFCSATGQKMTACLALLGELKANKALDTPSSPPHLYLHQTISARFALGRSNKSYGGSQKRLNMPRRW